MHTFVEFYNSTNTDTDRSNDQTEVVIKIIGLLSYIIASGFGTCLILGIIHYEKFGQDPQKRSFSDQIFTFNCVMFVMASFVYYTVSEIRWLFGPVGYFLATLKYYAFSAILCIPLGKSQFQICVWVVAQLPQRLKSTFFCESNYF